MKKIITSAGMIVFVAALVAGGTGAFFSDTETSTGNVFTAGSIDLTVDSEAHYNGSICQIDTEDFDNDENVEEYLWLGGEEYPVGLPCTGTWEATDLGAQTFFDFDDVKPGDEGENTISLHIDSNPAWACVDVSITANDDVSSTEPELDGTGDVPEDGGDDFDGELAQNLNFAAWLDQGNNPGWQNSDEDEGNDDEGEGDNIWQGDEVEPLLFSNETGPASDVLGGVSYALADSETGPGPMEPNVTNYIGLAWCAGTQVVDSENDVITCDGSALGNIVQTDSMEATIAFRVEQSRNNDDFVCDPEIVEPVTTLSLEKVIQQDQDNPVTEASWTLFADGAVQDLSGSEGDAGVTNVPVDAGSFTLSESDLAGFTQTDLQCTGATSLVGDVVTIDEGQNVTCTFFNTENTLIN